MEIITLNGTISSIQNVVFPIKKKRDLHFNVCSPNEQLRVFSELLIPETLRRVALYILVCLPACQAGDHVQKQSLFLG